eukprot:TRINITY_DN3560_c0_g1_i4.p1 TRINITY_DN3560_c0_g1~~TRINITY_DN3560_c0_g1_i4.p1  ORF type:complete len:623 (+),score=94.12 TRINITY_DN3560_c0_g1_i4:552-2420(+)
MEGSEHPPSPEPTGLNSNKESDIYRVLLQFSLIERTELIQQFRNIEKKTQNRISYSEFAEALDIFGNRNVDNPFSRFLFLAFQGKALNYLTDLEFMNHVGILIRGTYPDKIRFGFFLADLDRDGQILKEELVTLLQAMYYFLQAIKIPADQSLIEPFVDRLFDAVSEDNVKPTKLSYKQFHQIVSTYPKRVVGLGLLTPSREAPLKPYPKPTYKSSSRISVFIGSEHFSLVMNILLAIRRSSESTKDYVNRQIEPSDFLHRPRHKLPGTHTREKLSFCDYAPRVFRRLRKMAGVTEDEYLISLGLEQVLGNFLIGNLSTLSVKPSEGKSGSLFFYSWNGSFLVKTISRFEKSTLLKMLPAYFQYLEQNPRSLLTRFLGFFKLNKHIFIVMGNILDPETPFPPNQIFDLKGSTYGRQSSSKQSIKKDLNFVNERVFSYLSPESRSSFIQQLVRDSMFLESQSIIDYSLLVGIYDPTHGKDLPSDPKMVELQQKKYVNDVDSNPLFRVMNGVDKNYLELYYVGVIDILTSYNILKSAESFVKSFVHDKEEISAIPPPEYGERFRQFTTSLFPKGKLNTAGACLSAPGSPRTTLEGVHVRIYAPLASDLMFLDEKKRISVTTDEA